MSKVVWLPESVEDLERLRAFLIEKNPDAARRAAQVIINGTRSLAEFPEIGRPMNDGTERRELFEAFGSGGYILRYILDHETLVIIRVWHSKETREH